MRQVNGILAHFLVLDLILDGDEILILVEILILGPDRYKIHFYLLSESSIWILYWRIILSNGIFEYYCRKYPETHTISEAILDILH